MLCIGRGVFFLYYIIVILYYIFLVVFVSFLFLSYDLYNT